MNSEINEGDEMRKSKTLSLDKTTALLDAVGGEQVTGTGFEEEEPEPGFAVEDLSDREIRSTQSE